MSLPFASGITRSATQGGRFTKLRLQERSHKERRPSLTHRVSLRLRRTNRAFVWHSNRSTDTVRIEADHDMIREDHLTPRREPTTSEVFVPRLRKFRMGLAVLRSAQKLPSTSRFLMVTIP